MTVIFAGGVVALTAFLLSFSYTRKAHVVGVLVPDHGIVKVVAGQQGNITKRHVVQGQTVTAGTELFEVTNERSLSRELAVENRVTALVNARRESAVLELEQAQAQSRQREAAIRLREQALAREMDHLRAQTALQLRRVAISEQTVQRHEELRQSSFISAAQVLDRQADLLDQQQRLAELERDMAGLRRELAAAEAERQTVVAQARKDGQSATRTIALIDQELVENEARRRVVVRAAQSGIVATINVDVGQAIGADHVLASIVPSPSRLEAELYVPSRSAGFLKVGMPVRLRYQSFPYQKFGQHSGTVREVAQAAMRSEDLVMPGVAAMATTSGQPLYRVRVRLEKETVSAYGGEQRLAPGTVLEADILLESRRLIEWVLEPLYTISGRV